MRHILAFIALIALQSISFANGSFFLEDIEPLLKQQPELWTFLKSTMEIRDVGDAPRINVKQSKNLSGTRIAPYSIEAKPKGQKGDFTLVIEVCAETIFFDLNGKRTTLDKAVDIKEQLKGIYIHQKTINE